MSLQTPIEIGLGGYLTRFYAKLQPDTPALREFAARGASKSIAWAPGRMIGAVEDMLAEWRANDNDGSHGLSSFLPVMFVCLAKDYLPGQVEHRRAIADPVNYSHPDDPLKRNFRMQVAVRDIQGQVVIVAPESHTASSIALQLDLFFKQHNNRKFDAIYHFADLDHPFPVTFEHPMMGATDAKVDQKNITILIFDLVLRASIPLFHSPGEGEPNDGKAAPPGYPLVDVVVGRSGATGSTSTTTYDGDAAETEYRP